VLRPRCGLLTAERYHACVSRDLLRTRRHLRLARPVSALALGALFGVSACDPGTSTSPPPPTGPERTVAELRLAGAPVEEGARKPDFVLTDTRGEPYDFRRETAGRLTLLFFGYTSCPDVCPVHLANLAAALRGDPEVRRAVEVVFVGVDPERDTPERVRSFLDGFDPSFVGLTGSPEALATAQRAAGVPEAFVDATWEEGYSVSHAGWILLYTQDGRARLRYPFGTRQKEWAHDLGVLVRRGWPDDAGASARAEGSALVSSPEAGKAALEDAEATREADA